jgi:8-oxo-dGTP pyrophosphatase MutT (NUDIX family)
MQDPAKWQIVSSKPLLRDRWINLRADTCRTELGSTIEPFYVLTYPDWVHVVAITPDDCLVLVRQYRHAAGEAFLELPGGVMDHADGQPEDTARRELAEETGYQADEMRLVSSLYVNPSSHTNRIHTCLATGVLPSSIPRLEVGEEGLAVELTPLSRVLANLNGGLIRESMHVSSILIALSAANRIQINRCSV